MKNTYRKIYWTIAIVWALIAVVCAFIYAYISPAEALWSISYWSMIALFILVLIFALGFAIVQIVKGLITEPKKQIGIISAVVLLIIIFVVSYILASGTDVPQLLFERTGSNYDNSKLIGASLYVVYALLGLVVLSVLYSEITKKLK
ncbi:MAG: hypothetical protein LBR28_00850 [Bacteroidales bacterium]|jgi:hypothetical protein|nr:hypothetical protein [Bacteroidales bacterium]